MNNLSKYITEKLKLDKNLDCSTSLNFKDFPKFFDSLKDFFLKEYELSNGKDYTYLYESNEDSLTIEFKSHIKQEFILEMYHALDRAFNEVESKERHHSSVMCSIEHKKIYFLLYFKNE